MIDNTTKGLTDNDFQKTGSWEKGSPCAFCARPAVRVVLDRPVCEEHSPRARPSLLKNAQFNFDAQPTD